MSVEPNKILTDEIIKGLLEENEKLKSDNIDRITYIERTDAIMGNTKQLAIMNKHLDDLIAAINRRATQS